MKRILFSLLIILISVSAQAQMMERRLMTRNQPTGETLNIYDEGNSSLVFYSTEDGYAVLQTDGGYYYALKTSKGLVASSQLAHNPGERNAEETSFVQANAITATQARTTPVAHRSPLKASARTSTGLGEYGKPANGTVSSIGAPIIPVIMVEFTDRKFQSTTTIEKMTRYLNEEGYSDETNTAGSVRDYFVAQSNGMFSPTFVVVAKVSASQNYAYYGADDGTKRDPNLSLLIKEAIDSAVVAGADFSTMLVNSKVPLVTVIFAGPGEHNSYEDGREDYLWAQFNTFSYKSSLGGPTFSSFFIGDEIMQQYSVTKNGSSVVYNVTGSRFEGMGVFCHEFGHALGLPDFYNTTTGGGVVDYWSVMDYGQYYLNGYRPIGYSAYERNFMGWLKINDLDDQQQVVSIYPIGSSEGTDQQAYRIVNPNSAYEYYILENRQAGTWYPERLGTGLLIYHVNYLATAWSGNTPNNEASNLRYTVYPADGENQVYATLRKKDYTADQAYAAFAGDVFPGTSAVTSIASFPVKTGSDIATPIYNIAVNANNNITFQYLDLPQPANTFVRIKSQATGDYVGKPTDSSTPMVADASDADIFYVTSTNQLVSVAKGLFLTTDNSYFYKDEPGADGIVYTFDVSKKSTGATAGTYSVASNGSYLCALTDQENNNILYANSTGDDARCEFVLEEVTELPISINTVTGYATFNLPVPFTVPDGVTVLYVSRAHDNLLSVTETGFTSVAANQPVMLCKEGGGDITITLASSGQTVDSNLLTATAVGGTVVPASTDAYIYVLDDTNTSASFYLLNDTDRGIAGFKAYYASTSSGSAPQYMLIDDGTLTGIQQVGLHNIIGSGVVYDMQGRCVNANGRIPSGIYIVKQGNRSQKVTIR